MLICLHCQLWKSQRAGEQGGTSWDGSVGELMTLPAHKCRKWWGARKRVHTNYTAFKNLSKTTLVRHGDQTRPYRTRMERVARHDNRYLRPRPSLESPFPFQSPAAHILFGSWQSNPPISNARVHFKQDHSQYDCMQALPRSLAVHTVNVAAIVEQEKLPAGRPPPSRRSC